MKTKAILFSAPGQVELREVTIPDPEPDEVLIKTAFTCINPATELRVLAGQQLGMPEFPLIPGGALAGIVIASGGDAGILPGTRVLCNGTSRIEEDKVARCGGGHCGHAVCRASDIYLLPATLSLRDAPLTALAAIAHRGIQHSRPQKSETVIVIGLDPIGVLSARLHALSGARVIGADLRPERAELVRRSGLEAVSGDTLFEELHALVPEGASVIVDTTCAPEIVEKAIRLAHDVPFGESEQLGARYILQGSYSETLPLPYQAAFMKELTFVLPRNTRPQDIRQTLELIAQRKLVVHDLASMTLPAEEALPAYELLRQRTPEIQSILFEWSRF
ncbi:zinc-binding dehydrogenase [Armatimonas sp.]|uniref:zinc-binding dehydrogenase n=1 Tax=Armatimonas sp. TaxID=1872638 RepID=UPI003750C2A9